MPCKYARAGALSAPIGPLISSGGGVAVFCTHSHEFNREFTMTLGFEFCSFDLYRKCV